MPNLATRIFLQHVKWTAIIMLVQVSSYLIPGWLGINTSTDTSSAMMDTLIFMMGIIFMYSLFNIPVCGIAGIILLTQTKYKGYGVLGLIAAIAFSLYVKYVVGNGF